jgi:two-component system sensor histidine kinase KdpD
MATAAATAVGWPLYHGFELPHEGRTPVLENTNVLMLYLLGVLLVATRCGRGPATLASVLGVAVFDFCFVPPYLRFTVHDPQYAVTFAVMLLTALTIGTLTHRVRQQAHAARRRERRTQILLALSRALAAAPTRADVVAATVRHVSAVLGGRTVLFLLGADGQLTLGGDSAGGSVPLDPVEHRAARRAFEHDGSAGDGAAPECPDGGGIYIRAKASRGAVGVLGVLPAAGDDGAAAGGGGADDGEGGASGGGGTRAERQRLVEAFASQAALAVERAALAEEAKAAWERVEAEFVRNTLLSGVSHDLRTPLAAITGAVSSLTETGDRLPPPARAEMLETIYDEAGRMERLINNLLDMTRLEAGGLVLRREWHPLQEVAGSALRHLDRRLGGREVRVDVPGDLPLVELDAVAIEQVLVNLIDNAIEYAPPSAPIEIVARAAEDAVTVEVADRGPGLPKGGEARVFEKFFRAPVGDGPGRRGIGLGLAICRGIIEAHGGTISAANRPGSPDAGDGGRGAAFRFTLPRGGAPPGVDGTA